MNDIDKGTKIHTEIEDNTRYYDNTMLEAHRRCARKFYFRHVRYWNPESMAYPLGFGLSWHDAMDFVWKNAKELSDKALLVGAIETFNNSWKKWDMPITDEILMSMYPRTPGRAMEMLGHYIEKYYDWLNQIELLEVESSFVVPVDEEHFSDVMYMGRLDKVYRDPRMNNKVVISDHKTTSQMAHGWFESFSPNSQVDGYQYAGKMLYGEEFWGILIDGASVMKNHSAKGPSVDRDLPPGIAFPRIPISRALNQLSAWHWEAKETILNIEHDLNILAEIDKNPTLNKEFLMCFPKNTTNCFCYGRCIYADVCKMFANPHIDMRETPDGFVVDKWDPRNH